MSQVSAYSLAVPGRSQTHAAESGKTANNWCGTLTVDIRQRHTLHDGQAEDSAAADQEAGSDFRGAIAEARLPGLRHIDYYHP